MSTEYQICFIKPPDYAGSLVFREVLFLLRNSLRDLGCQVEIVPNQLAPDKVNIVIGYHLLDYGEYLRDVRYIPFQFEQLDTKEGWYSETVEKVLAGAEEIWDYSTVNIEFLKEKGLEARHVPMGYHRDLEIVPRGLSKDIDVLFYGSVNERRKSLLEKLAQRCTVHFAAGAFGQERDQLIARSRIVLNLHYYQTSIMEAVRISYLLNNGSFVISESSADDAFPPVDLVTADYDEIVETCREYLDRPERIPSIAKENYRQFKQKQAMKDILAEVVKR
jgi:hypothetical protein